jgi:hypothetical protein
LNSVYNIKVPEKNGKTTLVDKTAKHHNNSKVPPKETKLAEE